MISSEQRTDEHRPNVSWGAIFAGAFVALATQLIFITLGSAIGFTQFNPGQGDNIGQGSLIAAGVYALVTTLISLFLGGMAAGRLAGFRLGSINALHGLCSWAVVSALSLWMLGSGIGSVLGGAFGILGSGVQGIASAGAGAAGQSGVSGKEIAKTAQGGVQQEEVSRLLSEQLGLPRSQIDSALSKAQDEAGQVASDVRAKAPEIAQKGSKVAAGVSWTAFLALLLGGAAATFGGYFGGPKGVRLVRKEEPKELRRAA